MSRSPRPESKRPLELPDVRDGLTATERLVLTTLSELQKARGGRNVPVIELWGRLSEHVSLSLSQNELQAILKRLGA